MSYDNIENSVSNGEPTELYKFTYNGEDYTYTSSLRSKSVVIDGTQVTFYPEYIKRDSSLKLGSQDGSIETTKVYVKRTNSIALLYQGAPPEEGTVKITIYRYHEDDNSDIVILARGIVSQVSFSGSEATLTITIENLLSRNIPRGTFSYYCQNSIYDNKCSLLEDNYAVICYLDEGVAGLTFYSTNLREKPSGYFTDGYMKMGNSYRAIKVHEDDHITIKYPIAESDKQGSFIVYPGCNGLFLTCHSKFNNTDNFTGVSYCKPMDPVKNRTGVGSYWINTSVITRGTDGFINT